MAMAAGMHTKSKAAPPRPSAKPYAAPSAAPAAPTAQAQAPSAFAVLPTGTGPVLAPQHAVDGMLQADWTLFLEFTSYTLAGFDKGRVALGLEEVSEAVDQGMVAVLFVGVSSGPCGEQAVRNVVAFGGRGYIIGARHPLYEDLDDWGAAALLRSPLETKPLPEELLREPDLLREPEPLAKRQRVGALDFATAKAMPPAPPPELAVQVAFVDVKVSIKDLRHDLKALGRPDSLKDATAIPRTADSVREHYLPALGADSVFKAFMEIFRKAKGVAHRKSLLYVVYELFMAKRGAAMKPPECRMSCLEHFLLCLGPLVQGFRSDEREAYVASLGRWSKARVMLPAELAQIKDAWDMD